MSAGAASKERETPLAQTSERRSPASLPPRNVLRALLSDSGDANPSLWLKIIAASSAVLAAIGVGFVLQVARPIMLPLTAAVVISLLLAPVADWLGRRGLPEGLRAGLVVAAALAVIFIAFYFMGGPAIAWFERLPEVAEEARVKLARVERAVTQVQEVSEQVREMADVSPETPAEAPQEVVVRDNAFSGALATSARAALVQILFTTVLAYFLLASRSDFRAKAMALRPTIAGKIRIARTLRNIQRNVGTYMLTMLMINIGLGAVVSAGQAAIGMPSPLVWGLLAALLNFVPYLGPAILTILLGISGIVNYETAPMMAAPALIFVVANVIESNFVTPALVGVRLKISPLAILVAIAFLSWMWGPVGAVIAIPLVVVLKTVCDATPALRPLGMLIGEVQVVGKRRVGLPRRDAGPAPRRPPYKRRRSRAGR